MDCESNALDDFCHVHQVGQRVASLWPLFGGMAKVCVTFWLYSSGDLLQSLFLLAFTFIESSTENYNRRLFFIILLPSFALSQQFLPYLSVQLGVGYEGNRYNYKARESARILSTCCHLLVIMHQVHYNVRVDSVESLAYAGVVFYIFSCPVKIGISLIFLISTSIAITTIEMTSVITFVEALSVSLHPITKWLHSMEKIDVKQMKMDDLYAIVFLIESIGISLYNSTKRGRDCDDTAGKNDDGNVKRSRRRDRTHSQSSNGSSSNTNNMSKKASKSNQTGSGRSSKKRSSDTNKEQ
jgi:hypothetical protein